MVTPKKAVPKRKLAGKTVTAKATAKKPKGKRAAAQVTSRRADFGQPIDAFFANQPAAVRGVLDALRAMIQDAAPDATASLKWGQPLFAVDGTMMCALGGHKSHVTLILPGPLGTYADPDALLAGSGKTGRHLKITSVDELPRARVRGWLATAAKRAAAGEGRHG